MAWTIEVHVHEVLYWGGHLYIDIFNDSGNRVAQFNGLAVDRTTGAVTAVGGPEDQLMAFTDKILGGSGSSQATNTESGEVIFSGTEEQINLAIAYLSQLAKFINNQNVPYTLDAIAGFNSNSVFTAGIEALQSILSIDTDAVGRVANDYYTTPGYGESVLDGDTWAPNIEGGQIIGSIFHDTNPDNIVSGIAKKTFGTSGEDKLYGLDVNDKLVGREGNDLLDGGVGTDAAYYDNDSEKPTNPDTSVTLNFQPTQNYIEALLGDFVDADIKILDRYGDVDKLISIEKIVADASGIAQNVIKIQGDQTVENITSDSLEWNGQEYEFENFRTIKGDEGRQVLDIQSVGMNYDFGGGDDDAQIGGAGNIIYSGEGHDEFTIALRDGAQAFLPMRHQTTQLPVLVKL